MALELFIALYCIMLYCIVLYCVVLCCVLLCSFCRYAKRMQVIVFCVQDTISLRGEVFFPNLQFDKLAVDFGCILNDTEVTRYIHMTNTSPMAIIYQWSFVLSDQPVAMFHESPAIMESEVVVEDLDNTDADLSVTERRDDVDVGVKDEMLPAVQVDIAVEGPTDSPRSVRTSSRLCPCVTLYLLLVLIFTFHQLSLS